MGERMTSAEARAYLRGGPVGFSLVLARAADALEAWEREAEARAGMPVLRFAWGLMTEGNSVEVGWGTASSALDSLHARNAGGKHPHYVRAVRLAVVEVAEPEPPRPVLEQGPSGFEYEVEDGGRVVVYDCGLPVEVWGRSYSAPPADRALVARLLGEVG